MPMTSLDFSQNNPSPFANLQNARQGPGLYLGYTDPNGWHPARPGTPEPSRENSQLGGVAVENSGINNGFANYPHWLYAQGGAGRAYPNFNQGGSVAPGLASGGSDDALEPVHISRQEGDILDQLQGVKMTDPHSGLRCYSGLSHCLAQPHIQQQMLYLAKGGRAKKRSLKRQGKLGRYGDTEVALMPSHMTKLLDACMGGCSINPRTGHKEFFGASDLLKGIPSLVGPITTGVNTYGETGDPMGSVMAGVNKYNRENPNNPLVKYVGPVMDAVNHGQNAYNHAKEGNYGGVIEELLKGGKGVWDTFQDPEQGIKDAQRGMTFNDKLRLPDAQKTQAQRDASARFNEAVHSHLPMWQDARRQQAELAASKGF